MLHHSAGQTAQRLLLLGLGKTDKGDIKPDVFIAALSALHSAVKTSPYKRLSLALTGVSVTCHDPSWLSSKVAQVLTTELWRFEQFKSKKEKKRPLNKITVNADGTVAAVKTA